MEQEIDRQMGAAGSGELLQVESLLLNSCGGSDIKFRLSVSLGRCFTKTYNKPFVMIETANIHSPCVKYGSLVRFPSVLIMRL